MITELTAADGHELDCWMEPAEGTARGSLVILQEIFGLTDQLKDVGQNYAREGYQVAIPALFDRNRKGLVIPFEEAARGRETMQGLKLEETMLDVGAAVAALSEGGHKVGVIGFCWGGGLALRAAQVLDVSAAVAFYGTQMKKYLDRPLRAPVLALCGRQDDHTPPEVMEEVTAKLPEIEVVWYDAGHAFANEARPQVYDAASAADAHEKAKAFLREHLG